jgi:hypothetical protein
MFGESAEGAHGKIQVQAARDGEAGAHCAVSAVAAVANMSAMVQELN